MARGKKAAGAARRRLAQDAALVASLIGEIRREEELLAAARESAALVEELDARTRAASQRRDRSIAPEITRLSAEIALWEQIRSEAQPLLNRAKDLNNRWLTATCEFFGGGVVGFEAAVGVLGFDARVNNEGLRTKNLSPEAVAAIERARGISHRPFDEDYPLGLGLGPMIPSFLTDDVQALGITTATKISEVPDEHGDVFLAAFDRVFDAVTKSPVSRHPGTLALWRPSPIGHRMPASLEAQLGVPAAPLREAITVPPDTIPEPSAALSLAVRQRIAATVPPDVLVKSWEADLRWASSLGSRFKRYESSLARRPRVARPIDAALLRSHYFLAGIGQMLREGVDATPGLAEVTVGCGAASPHWLPPGQTVAFMDGDPMPEESRDDLRLPFPQVFVAFSDPLRIPGLDGAPRPALDGLLSKVPRDLANDPRTDITLRDFVPAYGTLPEIIDYHGAWVEGLVLLSDSLGRPLDTVGWCIAVVPNPGVTIARMLVPASREACLIPGVIDSVEAILSWAGWDAPDTAAVPVTPSADLIRAILDDPKVDRDSYRTDLGRVHVLNVRRTHMGSGDGDGTGASVAPHLRRGHWRRQRVGVGRAEVRWVRVAATAVNAGKGALTPQVYRLPSAAAAKPALADSA